MTWQAIKREVRAGWRESAWVWRWVLWALPGIFAISAIETLLFHQRQATPFGWIASGFWGAFAMVKAQRWRL